MIFSWRTGFLSAAIFWVSTLVFANDSVGYVGTGGIRYLKNASVAMQSEDLFISKSEVRVTYQFKNLSVEDVRETVLFPLPKMHPQEYSDSDYADLAGLIDSFRVQVNGQPVTPEVHVRAFMPIFDENGMIDLSAPADDITEDLQRCGLSDRELMAPWTQQLVRDQGGRLAACRINGESISSWSAQVVYSWTQVFPANANTEITHRYRPLVGGSVVLMREVADAACTDAGILRLGNESHLPLGYSTLSYVLTTGANWAQPIANFHLTIEREENEWLALCWEGELNKVSETRFEAEETDFTPNRDLDILFIYRPIK